MLRLEVIFNSEGAVVSTKKLPLSTTALNVFKTVLPAVSFKVLPFKLKVGLPTLLATIEMPLRSV